LTQKKIIVIGLDSMPDTEIFEKRKDELPNLRKMMENGMYATLESCHPPITVPAWRVMMSSKSPGHTMKDGLQHLYHLRNQWYGTF
jgi:predicted AlkP superfamily phosphohydrolase/phosphomutase